MNATIHSHRFPRVPRQARSRAKYDALLRAALAQFAEHGYAGATIDAIASQAGVSVGIFYSYFASKQQILQALMERRLEQGLVEVPSDLVSGPLSVENLVQILLRLLVGAREFTGLRRAMQELALIDPELARTQNAWQARVHRLLVEGLQRHQTRGYLRSDIDVDAAATLIFSTFGSLRDALIDRPNAEMERLLRPAATLLYHMLVPDVTTTNSPGFRKETL